MKCCGNAVGNTHLVDTAALRQGCHTPATHVPDGKYLPGAAIIYCVKCKLQLDVDSTQSLFVPSLFIPDVASILERTQLFHDKFVHSQCKQLDFTCCKTTCFLKHTYINLW